MALSAVPPFSQVSQGPSLQWTRIRIAKARMKQIADRHAPRDSYTASPALFVLWGEGCVYDDGLE